MINSSVPREAVLIYNRALELSNRGENERALEEYRRAIAAYPNFVAAHNNIGEIYSRMGDVEKAVASYLEALKIEKHHRVLLNLGVEYYNRGDRDKALTCFSQSLKDNPDFLEGHFYSGLIHYDKNDYKKAEKHLLKVTAIDERHVKANYLLSHIYYEWKEYAKAMACLDRIRDLAEDKSFIHRYYGFCCFFLGRYDDAVRHLTEALECKPQYARFKKYLEQLTFENKIREIGDVEEAIRELEAEIADRDPHVIDLTKLGMLYIFKGEYKKAERLLLSYKKKLA